MKLFLAALALFIASCTTVPQDPAQAVFAASSAYAGALSVAVAYKKLQDCAQPAKPVPCSDAAVVAELQRADDVAYFALAAAQKVARTPGAGANVATALNTATQAIAAFTAITTRLSTK